MAGKKRTQPVTAVPKNAIDMSGMVFGRLTVVGIAPNRLSLLWLCQCECGNTKIVSGGQLRRGKTFSCGCLYKETHAIGARVKPLTRERDFTGRVFGKLTVLGPSPRRPKMVQEWRCACQCGRETVVTNSHLKNGYSRSCGCSHFAHEPKKNLSGQVFGRLVVLDAFRRLRGTWMWSCRCKCGAEVSVSAGSLLRGTTKSCGCYSRDAKHRPRHRGGLGASRICQIWRGMLRRCHDPNASGYDNYGGRGVTVCDKWRNSFEAFLSDMGPIPSPLHSIDRIDNDGHYEPGNCRWATAREQCRNTRKTVFWEFGGRVKCIAEWAEQFGIKKNTLWHRVAVGGWSIERALKTPVPQLKGHH